MGDRLLSVPPSIAFWFAIVLYGLAAAAYLFGFLAARPNVSRAARVLLVLAFLAHGVDIGWRGVERVHPAASAREAFGFLAWLMAGGFLFATWRFRVDLAGVVASAVTLALLAVARLSPAGEQQEGLTALGRIHIMLAVTGVALFAIATVLAILWLVEERGLKHKKFALTFQANSAPLEKLDQFSHRLVLAGFPIFTVAVALGIAWVSQLGKSMDRPEYPFAIASWATFAVLIAARVVYGWRGRRTALLTLAGFAAAVVVLVIYLVRRSMG